MAPNAPRLAFWVTLGMRGTDVAQFEYADHVEVTLGLPRPLILHPAPATAQAGAAEVRQRFVMRFGAQQVRSVEGGSALTSILAEAGITHVHTLAGDCNSMPPELRCRTARRRCLQGDELQELHFGASLLSHLHERTEHARCCRGAGGSIHGVSAAVLLTPTQRLR